MRPMLLAVALSMKVVGRSSAARIFGKTAITFIYWRLCEGYCYTDLEGTQKV